jgi:hypothetical protein
MHHPFIVGKRKKHIENPPSASADSDFCLPHLRMQITENDHLNLDITLNPWAR